MDDLVQFEQGTHGVRAILRGPWAVWMQKSLESRHVTEIELNSGKGWRGEDLSFLSNFPALRALRILDQTIQNIEAIHGLKNLELLHLSTYFRTRIRLDEFPHLRDCALEWGPGAESLFSCPAIETLFVNRYSGRSIEPFLRLGKLRDLAIYSSSFDSLEGIGRISKIERLRLTLLRRLTSLRGIEELTELRELTITTCRKIADVGPVAALEKLEVLHLDNCGTIASLRPLSRLLKLRVLTFVATTSIRDGDLSPIRGLLALEYLAFQPRPHYSHRREDFADPNTGKVRTALGRA